MPLSCVLSGFNRIVSAFLLALVCAPARAQGQTAPPQPKPAAPLARWIELQNATLNLRYRVADNSAGTVTTNQLQPRESLRARFKLAAPGKYALNLGVFSGSRFTSSWNNTGIGLGGWQKTLAARVLYFAAQPVAGVEGQYGSMFIIKGESTEITTYDDDGYVIGERVSVRRPRELFFDEMSATVGYFTGHPAEFGITKRVKYLDERPNYGHFLVDKKFGSRAAVSSDFTSVAGVRTWRAATNVNTRPIQVADSINLETYKRTNRNPDYGFAVTLNKAVNRQLSLNWGYAKIDPLYGGLNADRFNIGKRVFFMTTYTLSPRFTASWFVTTAVGENIALPQRTLSNAVFSYNALPDLRRTGLF
ncbi:MAG: hypothetical protein ABIS29_09755 [Vicinamibacterales bacterium]